MTLDLQFHLNDKLVDAVLTRDHDEIVRLLNAGAQINHQDKLGNTPLHLAGADTDAKTCQLLIERGADVHARNTEGQTPLSEAAHTGRTDVCAALIAAGADVNVMSNEGETALLDAAREKRLNTCVLLLQHKADPNLQCADGFSPLLWAVAGVPVSNKPQVKFVSSMSEAGRSSSVLIAALVEAGAALLPNARRENPLHWAVSQEVDLKLFKVLISAAKGTQDLDLQDNKGASPLHLAAQAGNKDFCLEMLAAGANPLLEFEGATAHELAMDNGHEELASVLKAHADSKRAMIFIEDVMLQKKSLLLSSTQNLQK